MSETSDLVLYCREIRLLATFWWGCAMAGGIVAISFGCLYHFGVRFRMPRSRATIKRLARDRDIARAEREAAIANASDDASRSAAAIGALRLRVEEIGVQAQQDLAAADAATRREREIRRRTEQRLVDQNVELADANDRAKTLEALLLAVNANYSVEPGSPDSWVPDQPAAAGS